VFVHITLHTLTVCSVYRLTCARFLAARCLGARFFGVRFLGARCTVSVHDFSKSHDCRRKNHDFSVHLILVHDCAYFPGGRCERRPPKSAPKYALRRKKKLIVREGFIRKVRRRAQNRAPRNFRAAQKYAWRRTLAHVGARFPCRRTFLSPHVFAQKKNVLQPILASRSGGIPSGTRQRWRPSAAACPYGLSTGLPKQLVARVFAGHVLQHGLLRSSTIGAPENCLQNKGNPLFVATLPCMNTAQNIICVELKSDFALRRIQLAFFLIGSPSVFAFCFFLTALFFPFSSGLGSR